MANLISSIFAKITSAFTAVLLTIGVISAPVIPAAPAINGEVVVASVVEKKTDVEVKEPVKEMSSVVVVKTALTPAPAQTFRTPSGAIIDARGNILNQEDLDALKFQMQKLISVSPIAQVPAPLPTTAPATEVYRTPSVATKVKVYLGGSGNQAIDDPSFSYLLDILGGSCETRYFGVVVLDQYGQNMSGIEATLKTSIGSLTKTITKDDKIFAASVPNQSPISEVGIGFWYSPTGINTAEVVEFRSGDAFVRGNINVGPAYTKRDPSHFRPTGNGFLTEDSSGSLVDPATMTCVTEQPPLR